MSDPYTTRGAMDDKLEEVRIDLTSLDLRTGVLRLPRRLHDAFGSGALDGTDFDTSEVYVLEFAAPRELRGLGQFFESHSLRPNDAVILRVSTGKLELQAYFRQRRRSEVARPTPETTAS